jgi:hypothetical protein
MAVDRSPRADVLQRFAAADEALRQAQERVHGLARAEDTARQATGSLKDAAASVSGFVDAAREALSVTTRVHEDMQAALAEAQRLTRSFDASVLLEEVQQARAETRSGADVERIRAERVESTLLSAVQHVAQVDLRLTALVKAQSEYSSQLEHHMEGIAEAAAKVATRTARQLTDLKSNVKALHDKITEDAEGHALAIEERLTAMEEQAEVRHAALIAGLQNVVGRSEEKITGIVDVLPKRSRKRLGR